MVAGECSKSYPKEYCKKTTIMENGHVRYARPRNGINVDNRFVVPHNVDLLVKYQAHINVERVNRDGSIFLKDLTVQELASSVEKHLVHPLAKELMRFVNTWNADVLLPMRQHGGCFSLTFTTLIPRLSV